MAPSSRILFFLGLSLPAAALAQDPAVFMGRAARPHASGAGAGQAVSGATATRHWEAGVQLVLKGRRKEALSEWEACLKAEPSRDACRVGLILLGADPEEAMANEVAQHYKAGLLYFDAGHRAQARAEWTACLRLSPGNGDCRAGLAKLGIDPLKSADALAEDAESAYKRGDLEAAGGAARAALEKDPGNRVAQAVWKLTKSKQEAVARAARRRGRAALPPEEARREATKHWNSGIIYFQKGDFPKAREEWLLCKQYDAGNQDCLTGLQRVESAMGAADGRP